MQLYNCIIIEDEPLAAEVLQDYINDIPFLVLKNIHSNAISALRDLQTNQIDLVFLDINLPKLKGIDFIKTLKDAPHIIITTAYHEYAIEGYELNIIDYLLKPIEFNRFLKAVNKLKTIASPRDISAQVFKPESKDYLFVQADRRKVKLFFNDILYIESLKEYVRIITKNKILVTKFQLGQIEEYLAKEDFIRIHRSYIIAKNEIDSYTSTEVEIRGKIIPIGRSYKELVVDLLN